MQLTPAQLVDRWKWQKEPESLRLPVKTLRFNCCPAIAPLSVLNEASQKRVHITSQTIQTNLQLLRTATDLTTNIIKALELMDKQQQAKLFEDDCGVDGRLYDGFVGVTDKAKMSVVRTASLAELPKLDIRFDDDRLNALLPLYKARNLSKALTDEERQTWEAFRERKLIAGGTSSRFGKFMHRLGELDARPGLTGEQRYLLEELQLYAQRIIPADLPA